LDRIKRRISTNKRELVSPDNNGDTTQEAAIKKTTSTMLGLVNMQ